MHSLFESPQAHVCVQALPSIQYVPICALLLFKVSCRASVQASAGNETLATQWQAAVQAVLAQALQLPAAQPFAQPVPLDSVPGYREQIDRPMDLGTICRRAQEGHYRSSHQAWLDVQLVRWLGDTSGWHLWHCSLTKFGVARNCMLHQAMLDGPPAGQQV